MSIKITFEYECDICRVVINPPEIYEVSSAALCVAPKMPQPMQLPQVGYNHVCPSCLTVAIEALKKFRA